MTAILTGESRMLIDGSLTPANSGRLYDNINPATEEVLGQTSDATDDDMDRAIAAARRAFDESSWATDRELRKRCLSQLQQALEDEKEALRAELVAEVGSPVSITYIAQLEWPLAEALKTPIAIMDTFEWERPLPDTNFFAPSHRVVWREPVGVVAAIAPWNFPFEVTLNKLGPALAAGNTVVLKPAPDTPWNATRLGRLAVERTDMPPGVLNVVPTSDNAVAERLVTDSRVDMVSFTGSTGVGQRIARLATDTLKRTFLELGGKSALIVLDDADLDTVLQQAAFVGSVHAGQGCVINTRVLLPRSRYQRAVEILGAAVAQVPYGDPTDPQTVSGPLVNRRQLGVVLEYIEKGKAEGARVVTGGGRPEHLERGYYVAPTLLADVDNDMTVAREEIFGPVLCAIPYDDEDDAVRIANDSKYGLAGGVASASQERAMKVARRIRSGIMSVNGGMAYGADGPFGGCKMSGWGRQGGADGFDEYLNIRTIGYPD